MPKETYKPGGGDKVEPLEAGQYQNCVLEKINAFRQLQKDDDSGEEYMRTKLALYWNSGYSMPDGDEPFYLLDGFVTLSFHERSNLGKMLNALGFITPGEPVEYEYDLGGEYAGQGFDAIPVYAGSGPKGDVEVPVDMFRVNGRDLIGATATLIVSVKQSGYNKIDMVLSDAPKTTTRLGPRKAGDQGKAEAPVTGTTKKVAQRNGQPLWVTWRSRANAVKWAAGLRNSDGSAAYAARRDAESVWDALYPVFEQEVFEPTEREFYWHWYRWHINALKGEEFSFQDIPSSEETDFVYGVRGRHA